MTAITTTPTPEPPVAPSDGLPEVDAADNAAAAEKNSVMKVTLLSGFLGAGKTTLLKRILRLNNEREEADRLKMAVIVNDMGEINLDADEIKASKVIQEDAEMVEMHNGCICCTLRGDLLKTVKQLSGEGKFDYLVIESTGIGEPLPVAQTFAMDVDSMQQVHPHDHHHHDESKAVDPPEGEGEAVPDGTLRVATEEKKSLFHYAKLDTLVTVVDACNIFDVIGSIETLADEGNMTGMMGNTGSKADASAEFDKQREKVLGKLKSMEAEHLRRVCESRGLDNKGTKKALLDRVIQSFEKDLQEEIDRNVDDRPISRLWLDQIEFANVIVVSKAKQFMEEQNGEKKLEEIEILLKKLNPKAHVVVPREDKYGDLDVSKTLISTGLFDMEKAQVSQAWNEELLKEEHTPETEEYGISSMSFISNKMPFHPLRLAMIMNGFGNYESALKRSTNSGDKKEGGDEDKKKESEEDKKEDSDVDEVVVEEVAKSSLTTTTFSNDVFKGVIRTKGHLWLANANAYPIHLHTAGTQIHMRPGEQPFLVEIKNKLETQGFPDDAPEDEKEALTSWVAQRHKKSVEDGLWSDEWGDRRSQLVFIGVGLDKVKMRTMLEQALVTEEETEDMGGWEKWKDLADPFYGGKIADAHFSVSD